MAIGAALPDEQCRTDGPARFAAGTASRARRLAVPWRRCSRQDRWAMGLLFTLPVLLYLPFSLAGHPILPGDDLTQNYPLRLLAGNLLRSGHLPVWDPLVWSGTPLLAGWNGGSMFPMTWLFAVLPGVAAWTVAYVTNPIVASMGAYLLLRRLRCRPGSATVGALAFTYTGFMNGQAVHLGLVQGTALMPWTLLALELLGRRASAGERLSRLAGPAGLLGVAVGGTILAGDPRAVTTTAIVDAVYLVALLVRSRGAPRGLLGSTAVGVLLGGLVAAVQWLPGIRFVNSSQRGATAYGFFGAGSVDLGHIASFVLVPYLFGGNGNFGLPTYAGTYNLPELTFGTGVLATVAFMAFLPQVAGSARAWLGGRGAPGGGGALGGRRRGVGGAPGLPAPVAPPAAAAQVGRPLGVWYVLAVVGVLLTLGSYTPLGHLLVHVPLFGGERLQNRNSAIFDLPLVVLLAFLLDDLLDRRSAGALRSRSARALALVPLAATTVLVVLAYADPAWLRHFGGVSPSNSWLFTSMTVDNCWQLALVAGAAALVLRPERVAGRRGRIGLVALVVADVGLFVANQSFAGAPSALLDGSTALTAQVRQLAGPAGRVALYDPLNQAPASGPHTLQAAGAPDLNVPAGLGSVQGYGSIVSSSYDAATDTHGYENLAVGGLASTTFDTLDLRLLVTLPSYFGQTLGPGQGPPAPGTAIPGASATAAAGTPAAAIGGPYRIGGHATRTFMLASPEPVRFVSVTLGRPAEAAALRVSVAGRGSATGGDRTTRPVAFRAGGRGRPARALLPTGSRGDEIRVTNTGSRAVVVETVVADGGRPAQRVALDGPLQGALRDGHWHFEATLGDLVAWQNSRAGGLAWLEPLGSSSALPSDRAAGQVSTTVAAGTGIEATTVSSERPALLVRSESFTRGWTARLTPVGGGPTRVVRVRRLGVVQAVPVPAGRYEITWRYAPASILAGLLASAIGAAGLVALAAVAAVARRRRRSATAGPLQAGHSEAPGRPRAHA